MALIFADGFDVQFPDNDPGLWNGVVTDVSGTIQYLSVNPRSANGHVRFVSTGGAGDARLSLSKPSDAYCWIAGGFYYHSGGTDAGPIIQFYNPDGFRHLDVELDPVTGNLYFGDSLTNDKYGTTNITADAYHWIEIKFFSDSVNGYCVVQVDGVQVVNFSGDTEYSVGTNNNITEIQIGIYSGKFTLDVDDFMVFDQNGSALTGGFAGPSVVAPMFPESDVTANWTSTEATNYEAVDDCTPYGNAPDDDTSTISTDAAGDKSKWNLSDPTVTGGSQVHGVCTHIRIKKDSTGAGTVKHLLQVGAGGTEGVGPDQGVGTSYGWQHQGWDTVPGSANAFTLTDINNLIAGVEAG